MKYFITFLFAFSFSFINANTNSTEYLKDAVFVAQVKSFSSNGFLNCEFQCFLDLNYTTTEKSPKVFFQIGTTENPVKYYSIELNESNIESSLVEKSLHENGYRLNLNFGKISVKENFIARVAIVNEGKVEFVTISSTDFNNSMTIMNDEKTLAESGLCKAEQFLRKIDFDRLYKDYSYVEE